MLIWAAAVLTSLRRAVKDSKCQHFYIVSKNILTVLGFISNSPGYGGSGRRAKERFQRSNQNAASPRGTAPLWSKIIIPFGKNYEKDFLLKTLLNASKSPFMPIYVRKISKVNHVSQSN